MTDFVRVPMTADEGSLTDAFTARLQQEWPGWMPNDGDPEVRVAEALAPLAVNAAEQASSMPGEALIQFGVKLLGQPFNPGSPARAVVRLTMTDTAGYTVRAGSELAVDGHAFALAADTTVAFGAAGVDAVFMSRELTAAANDLPGDVVVPISMPAWVTGLQLTAPTDGGADPQTADEYLDQISRDRKLASRAIVTLSDMELVALDQDGIARATAAWTASREATVWVLGPDGGVVSDVARTVLAGILSDPTQRMVNVTAVVADPSFNAVTIAYVAKGEPGQDPDDLTARINSRIQTELSPLGYGGASPADWVADSTVRLNRMIAVVAQVAGVDYVESLTINGAAADLHMTGVVALPSVGAITGSVT